VLFQLVSHKLMRLVVPYFFVLMLLSATWMGMTSPVWAIVAIAQWGFWIAALLALRMKLPLIDRVASPASALLVLNVAAVAGLYKFWFTPGPLWKIWSPGGRVSPSAIPLKAGQENA
jgi:hypothetical protein